MFDMIDVIQMSKISKHYLLEYQSLLDSYEMQAPNVTSGFRVLDFSDDISDVDYTSDDWSVNESYSETSGEMTNSVQANILSNTPEYSVCAGSKPLSIIIRRCNTPTAVCSSPVQEIDKENSCTNSAVPPVPCEVTDLYTCQRDNGNDACGNNEPNKVEKCVEEPKDIVNKCNKDNGLFENKGNGLFDNKEVSCSKNLSRSPEKKLTNSLHVDKTNAEEKHVENFLDTNVQSTLLVADTFPCIDEVCSDSVNNSFLHSDEEKRSVSNNVSEKMVDDSSFLNHRTTGVEFSEYISHSEVSMISSNNINVDTSDVPKKLPHLSDEISKCVDVVSTNCNILNFEMDNERSNLTNEASQFIEVDNLTRSFCQENNDMSPKKNNNDFENCLIEPSGLCLDDSLDTNLFEGVDRWRQLSCSPLLFSSDDESSSIAEEVNKGIEAALAPSPQYNVVLSTEKKKVGKLQEMLMGAPPPPAVTMPLFNVSEMLDILRDTSSWMITNSKMSSSHSVNIPWDQEAATMRWPQVKCLQYPGIHYNHGSVSEQFETLCQKLLMRCVGAETASSVTVWSSFTLPAPRKERRLLSSQRAGSSAPTGLSPGRRLSHLARRHRTFSSASLLADGGRLHSALPHAAPERRTILVEGRKKESKKSRSSQKKRNLDRAKDAHSAKLNSSKRALFQSPTDEEKKAPAPSKFRPCSAAASAASASSVRSRRSLFAADAADGQRTIPSTSAGEAASSSASASRKRLRTESDDEMCRQLPRRRLFGDAEASGSSFSNNAGTRHSDVSGRSITCNPSARHPEASGQPVPNDANSRQSELSSFHKKKLLWAVAEALKKHGLGLQHPQFRACAAALGSMCRSHVQEVLAQREGSTSDRLLQLALRHVDKAVSQHIKGPSQADHPSSSEVR